ncbi:Bacterial conjugation TrbI-like protein [mine drainage metagenome]|uniref:Bacterial conjugation TrbI-like protein n=1 Tax=mine drainage metagenome TaxID=410659 RepID=T1C5Z8_9ZZZZ
MAERVTDAPSVKPPKARKTDPRKKVLLIFMMVIASVFAIALLASSLIQHKHKQVHQSTASLNQKYAEVTHPPSLIEARHVVHQSPVRVGARLPPTGAAFARGATARSSPASRAGRRAAGALEAKIAASPILTFHASGRGPVMNAQAQYDANLALKIRLARKLLAARQKEEARAAQVAQQPGLAQLLAHALPAQTGGPPGAVGATTVARTHEAAQFLHHPGSITHSARGVSISPPPNGPTLMPGSVIPAVLTSAIDSDLPGMITARTVSPVFDSIHERIVVIPRGSMITGFYSTDINAGQTRILASFTSIIFPDGWTVHLGGMTAADAYGRAGMPADVNNHFWTQFGSSFLIAALTTLLPTSTGVTLVGTGESTAQGVYGAGGQALLNVQQSMLSQYQNLPPTLIVHRGFRFNIMVSRPITLPFRTTAGNAPAGSGP